MGLSLLVALTLSGATPALACAGAPALWTASDRLAPDGYVVALAANPAEAATLARSDVHFVTARGRVDVTLTHSGLQTLIEPKSALAGTVTLAGLPQPWPQDAAWPVVERKVAPPTWRTDPTPLAPVALNLSPFATAWALPFELAASGRLVHFSARPAGGAPYWAFLAVVDGAAMLYGGACGSNLGGRFGPGEHEGALRPVGVDGRFGPARLIRFTVPRVGR